MTITQTNKQVANFYSQDALARRCELEYGFPANPNALDAAFAAGDEPEYLHMLNELAIPEPSAEHLLPCAQEVNMLLDRAEHTQFRSGSFLDALRSKNRTGAPLAPLSASDELPQGYDLDDANRTVTAYNLSRFGIASDEGGVVDGR